MANFELLLTLLRSDITTEKVMIIRFLFSETITSYANLCIQKCLAINKFVQFQNYLNINFGLIIIKPKPMIL